MQDDEDGREVAADIEALPEAADPVLPAIRLVRRYDLHRLIPAAGADGGAGLLAHIADGAEDLAALVELDHATDDRLLGENDLLPGIGVDELVFAVPQFRIVNAAFCHANPHGCRFGGPDRGAWYAAFSRETAIAEAAFHQSVALAEIGRFEDSVVYDDFLCDVSAMLADLCPAPPAEPPMGEGAPFAFDDEADDSDGDDSDDESAVADRPAPTGASVMATDAAHFTDCLEPDSYVASQALAEALVAAGGLGIVHPSVRDADGTCVALFRPALVGNVRRAATVRLTWTGDAEPLIAVD